MNKLLNLKMLAIAGVCTLFLTSCQEEQLSASWDGSNEYEGGPSKRVNSNDLGWNIMLNQQMGMSGAYGGHYNPSAGRDEKDWFPLGYEPMQAKGGWTFDLGEELVRKGSKIDGTATHLTYFNVVAAPTYHYPLERGELFGGIGPYLGYGLGGKVSGNGFSESAFGGSDGYKRFDAGVYLKAGYRFPNSLGFHLSYEYGLVNKSPDADYTSRNGTIALNVSYSLTRIISAFKR